MRRPDFLIAGVPKAGTSSLATWLREHPALWLTPDKELQYFHHRNAFRGDEWYLEQFAAAPADAVAGEATPTYVVDEHAFTAMADLVPDARVVVCVRDPVDRFFSDYHHQRSLGGEPRTDLTEVVDDELRHGPDRGRYLAGGRYDLILQRIARRFPVDRVLVVRFETIADDPAATYRMCCAFLGVDASGPVPAAVGTAVNVTTVLRSERLRRVMLQRHLFRRFGRLALRVDAWNRGRGVAPPAAPPELRRRLFDHYAPAIAAVEAHLGIELPAWRDLPQLTESAP